MRKKEKQKYFMEKLHKIYNDKNLKLMHPISYTLI